MPADLNQSLEMMLLLSLFAGAVHVFAPDHWVPASILNWKRRWSAIELLGYSFFFFSLHLGLGFLIYLALSPWIASIQPGQLFSFSLIFVGLSALIRMVRFSRMREMLRLGQNGIWNALTILSLLGPCESIVPIFIKAKQLGIGYLLPFFAFGLGTMTMGTLLIAFGRVVWNHPIWLPKGFVWANRRRAIIPVVAGVAIGLSWVLKI